MPHLTGLMYFSKPHLTVLMYVLKLRSSGLMYFLCFLKQMRLSRAPYASRPRRVYWSFRLSGMFLCFS
ncbi:MAG: hypothetical protein JO307_10230 [Bryobacterales bacterium]|nr:hypothetical protein [Bryobacterales bacterium]MBV9397857.1 hypothetical protein [Bryobacterales bacterium]